jgi:benzoate-CoA ligase family protein
MVGRAASIPEQFNVAQYFVDRNLDEGRGDFAAVFYREHRLTYRRIWELVNRAANALEGGGVQRLDRVLLLLHDSPAFAAAFLGAIKLGAVPVPVNTLLLPEDYEFMLRDSGARSLVVERALLQKVRPVLAKLSGGQRRWGDLETVYVAGQLLGSGTTVEYPGESERGNEPGYKSFDEEVDLSPPEAAAAPTHRDDPAFWLYTSGSTGRPKAAIHRHRDMVYCLEHYAGQVLGITAADRTYSTSKLFFAYGLGNALYFPFGMGASTVLVPERPTPDTVLEVLRRYQPTLFFAVPAVYAALLQAPGLRSRDFGSVRCAVSAGEALPAPLWERFRERFGVSILDGIGSTEMLHMFISNRPNDIVPGASGKLVPGYAARIVDELGREVPDGQMGELQIRGESAASGYWNRPELTPATFRGEWTVTGDKYVRDEHGYFRHCGRTDDMLKVSGLWVSPLEVEATLLAHPAVMECAVVGATDADGLTKPKAFVALRKPPTDPAAMAELCDFLRGRLPAYKVPRWIILVERLPRTATGKIQRFKLRQEH